MKVVNAACEAITAHLARTTCFNLGKKPSFVRMHPMQLVMVAELFECTAITAVAANLEDVEAVRKLAREYTPGSLLDIPIIQDSTMRSDVMEFLDEHRNIMAMIVNLPVPVLCEVSRQ